jgi:hypothetical protein
VPLLATSLRGPWYDSDEFALLSAVPFVGFDCALGDWIGVARKTFEPGDGRASHGGVALMILGIMKYPIISTQG